MRTCSWFGLLTAKTGEVVPSPAKMSDVKPVMCVISPPEMKRISARWLMNVASCVHG